MTADTTIMKETMLKLNNELVLAKYNIKTK